MTIKVLLVDDQSLFRGAVAALLARRPGIEVVGEAPDGLQGVALARESQPDVVIMDVEMPVMDGIEALRLIREHVPAAKVIMLSVSEADEHVGRAMAHGAHGYLLKDLRPEDLFATIESVVGRGTTPPRADPPAEQARRLTRRELEILRLVADGLSNKEIALQIGIAEGTVKSHVHNALAKLQMTNRIQAATYIVRHGLGSDD